MSDPIDKLTDIISQRDDQIARLRTEVEELREKLRTTHLYYQNQLQHNGSWAFVLIVVAFIIGINIS